MAGEDDARAAWAAAVTSGTLVAQHVASKATRDALFLSHFGLKALPAAMIGAALLSSFSVILMSRALTRRGPARVVPATLGLSAALFFVEWLVSLRDERIAAIAVYVHTATIGTAVVSAFWSLVNERFDPHQAKRLVSRIASGGTVGGIVGGLVVWRLAAHLSMSMMLALLACINGIGVLSALRTARAGGSRALLADDAIAASGGAQVVRETPYLQNLAALVGLGAIAQALLDWLLSAHATTFYGKGSDLLAFFAIFNMLVGVASFAAQAGLSRPVLDKLGLSETLKLPPTSVAFVSGIALFTPHLSAVILLRGIEAVMRNSLYRSAYELCYTPLSAAKKRPSKTLIDVGFDRIGTMVGGGALLGLAHLPLDIATRAVLISSIGVSIASWFLASRLHEGYVAALATSLKSGAIAFDVTDSLDLTTKKTLAETTALLERDKLLERIEAFQRAKDRDGGPIQVLVNEGPFSGPISSLSGSTLARDDIDLPPPSRRDDPFVNAVSALRSDNIAKVKAALAKPLDPALAAIAVPLLANDAIVRDVVRALRKVAPRSTGLLVDALLDRELDPRVRRRIPRILKASRTRRAADGLVAALEDPSFDVRVQVGLGLADMQKHAKIAIDRDTIFARAKEELTTHRPSWPRSEDRDPDGLKIGLAHVFTVLGLVLDREPLAIAYRALRAGDSALRGTAIEYLDVVLPPGLRELVVPLLGDVRREKTRTRDAGELAEALLKSTASLDLPRSR